VEALLITDTPQRDDPTAIAISIVSNSRLLSEGLLAILSPLLNLRLIEIYSGEFHANSPLPNPPGHVILLDSGVGHVSALAWTRHWHGLRPPGYILLVELTNNVELILECLEAGAGGYLLQETSGVEMVEAIKDARVGIAHCSPEIIARLVARQAAQITITHASPSPLTAREVEVLRWIAAGYTNLEIAGELFIELRTVKQHVHHILGKLHVRSRWEVARLAAERGWLDPISPLR
jgi:DNA-binding NarL/FixJ family response regulator